MQVFLFFTIRFSSASSVLLANDVFKLARKNTYTITDAVASILYDPDAFKKIQRVVLEMNNLDLKNLKSQFDTCIETKQSFTEPVGIHRYTDIQERSIQKVLSPEQIRLRAKYPFLI